MGVANNSDLLPIAYDSGINFIFTSGEYINGIPEREIGRFLRNKPRESFLHEPFLEVMTELKDRGRIRFIGGTTHRIEHIVLKAAADSNIGSHHQPPFC